MFKNEWIELESIIDNLKDNYNFKGLYHFTDFTNLKSILKTGFLKSRSQCNYEGIDFLDVANTEVIEHTKRDIKKCVRFYYKEKTPTLYKNEGIKKENMEPHVPIPVYLLFDFEIILLEDTIFSSCNAASKYVKFGRTANFFKNMDWDKIFHRNSLPMEEIPEKWEIIRKRNAELLSLKSVSLDYLNKIVFRSRADYKRAVNLFGKNEKFKVDCELFNCHNNYIEDYNIKVTVINKIKNIEVNLKFHKHDFKDYDHRIEIKEVNKRKLVYNNLIQFKDRTALKRHGKINNLPNCDLEFKYYINGILCIEETI